MTEPRPELEPELYESFTIRYGDVSISISSRPDGVLQYKSDDEVLKKCADILLQLTDTESLENKIEIPMAIQETLEKDFGWDKNKTFDFLRKLKKRLYMMNIGDSESKDDRAELIRKQRIEQAKERFAESTGIDVGDEKGTEVSVSSNVVTVIPKQQNFSKEGRDTPVEFAVSGDDASVVMPKAKPSSAPKTKNPPLRGKDE